MSPKAGGVRLTAAQNNLWADSSKLVRGGGGAFDFGGEK